MLNDDLRQMTVRQQIRRARKRHHWQFRGTSKPQYRLFALSYWACRGPHRYEPAAAYLKPRRLLRVLRAHSRWATAHDLHHFPAVNSILSSQLGGMVSSGREAKTPVDRREFRDSKRSLGISQHPWKGII